ncbi:hypothetical protein [Alienimonas californiensis]|nr:hypothetical protein [Alienimonas californiensis]
MSSPTLRLHTDQPDAPPAEGASPREEAPACDLLFIPSLPHPGHLVGSVLDPDGEPLHAGTLDPNDVDSVAAFLTDAERAAADNGLTFDARAGRREALRAGLELNAGAAPATTAAGPAPDAVLDALQLQVIAETAGGAALVYSKRTGKLSPLPNLGRLKKADLVQVAGPPATTLLEKPSSDRRPGQYLFGEAVQAIATAASEAPRQEAGNVWGQGVWRAGEELFVVNGDVVLCGDPDGSWAEYAGHRVGGKALARDRSAAWAPADLLDRLLSASDTDAADQLARLQTAVREWSWLRPGDADAAAGLIAAGYVPGTLSWRPLGEIVATSNSGKSVLVQRLLLPLWAGPSGRAVWINPSTEAGLRQHIDNTAMAYVADEWDSWGKHGERVQQFLRSAGRGGVTLRGTPGGKPLSTRCDSMVLRVGVHGLRGAPQDENRRMVINMAAPPVHRLPDLPPESELHELRAGLIVSAVRLARPADALIQSLNGVTVEGVHTRVAESFSVAAAFLTVFKHGAGASRDQAEARLLGLLEGRAGELDTVTNEESILHAMMSAPVRLSGSLKELPGSDRDSRPTEYPLGRLLGAEAGVKFFTGVARVDLRHREVRRELAARGFRVFHDQAEQGEPRIFVVGKVVCEKVLKGTRHEHADLNQILRRVDGAEASKQRLGPGLPSLNGVIVPLEAFDIAVVEMEGREGDAS